MEKFRDCKAMNGEFKRRGQNGTEKQDLSKIGLFRLFSRQISPVGKPEAIQATFSCCYLSTYGRGVQSVSAPISGMGPAGVIDNPSEARSVNRYRVPVWTST